MKFRKASVYCLLLVASVLTLDASANSPSSVTTDEAVPEEQPISHLMSLFVLQIGQKAYTKAAATLERAIRMDGDDPEFWHLLAHVRLLQGNYQQVFILGEKSNSLAGDDSSMKQRNEQLLIAAQRLANGESLAAVVDDLYQGTEQMPDQHLPRLTITIARGTVEPPPPIKKKIIPADEPRWSVLPKSMVDTRTTSFVFATTMKNPVFTSKENELFYKASQLVRRISEQKIEKPKKIATAEILRVDKDAKPAKKTKPAIKKSASSTKKAKLATKKPTLAKNKLRHKMKRSTQDMKKRPSVEKKVVTPQPSIINKNPKNRIAEKRSDKPTGKIARSGSRKAAVESSSTRQNDTQRVAMRTESKAGSQQAQIKPKSRERGVSKPRWAASGYSGLRYPINTPRKRWPKKVARAFE